VANSFQKRALRKAARIVGGETRLREMLDAPPGAFMRWLEGAEAMPEPVFLMVVDFLADMEAGTNPLNPPSLDPSLRR
jgi:hypothetical protein